MSIAPQAASGRTRAVLEALRAPLLLSPVADVLAGWCLAWGTTAATSASPGNAVAGLAAVALAALAGCCLLASGMAQNALVDLEQDRPRRPGRPLPRGAVRPRTLGAVMIVAALAALASAASVSREALVVAALVVVVTAAYHGGLKRLRVAGCIALGTARGLDMLLGAVAALALMPAGTSLSATALLGVLMYALYMTGASLHASTDDEEGSASWSRAGLGLAFAVLGAMLAGAIWRFGVHEAPTAAGAVVLVWAGARLARAALRLPPPALTGVALSNLHLVDAGLCLVAGPPALAAPSGLFVLGLFWVSRRLLAAFPPS